MYHILIVDDESKIRELIKKYAEFEGFNTSCAKDGFEAIEQCREHAFDLIVMDIMMPMLDGYSAVKEIKKVSDIPILMLSARGEEYDKLRGFELGIDDYVVKPFSGKELMMRIHAILARTLGKAKDNKKIEVDQLCLDRMAHLVTIDGHRITLTPKEYDLLHYLLINQNIALSRNQILESIWGYEYDGDDRTLDTHMKSLRKALLHYGNQIVTIRGVGYRFETK